MSSDRNFGFIMCAFFAIIALLPLRHGHEPRLWAGIIALTFLIPALFFSRILHPLNRAWMHFGELLSKIVSPIAMGIVFFGAITPFALIMRLFGKRPLDLKPNPKVVSYWKKRDPAGPDPQSMKDQF
ncbi:SxtJ family membrane protein [Undibacterium cyanobacteriorum]|uniref:SxtJ family membrane protein n=1 Tax=Undibacterium cyanobacteriorum TaxID=3073561 RepID=A0ABY9RKI9_9BURK|nr:SxtJ family membrane protein [Undibacterium sp. 20NA77.5]WMW81742.1 SxtJ family membrane protein [Undibacterium sp. 20NA77.5]